MKIKDIIAFSGILELELATWDSTWGNYARFKIQLEPQHATGVNPFKKFTGMRKGRVGSRFKAVLTVNGGDTVLDDEVMLKGWSDGTSGCKVTFWFADADHPLRLYSAGALFAVVLVELDDDEEPINQVKRDRLTKRGPTISNYAAQLCRTPEFQLWVFEQADVLPMNEEPAIGFCKEWMCSYLGIDSRAELDADSGLALRFHQTIREPYAAWYLKKFPKQ